MQSDLDRPGIPVDSDRIVLPSRHEGPLEVAEGSFLAARNVAYGCLAIIEELSIASFPYSAVRKTLVPAFPDFTILPADGKFSRITRGVEYLCNILDYTYDKPPLGSLDSVRIDWRETEGCGKIGRVKKWLLLASTSKPWNGCNTAHERAFYRAYYLWGSMLHYSHETWVWPSEYGRSFHLNLELVEASVEKIRTHLQEVGFNFRKARAAVECESERAMALWRAEGARDGSGAATDSALSQKQENLKAKGYSSNEFNHLAGEYLKRNATDKHRVTVRELEKYLKKKNPAGTCSLLTITGTKDGKRPGLPAWRAYQTELERAGRKGKKNKPAAITLKEGMSGEPDPELQRLIEEQEDDYEPSPLDKDLPDEPRQRVRHRKRV